MSSRRLSSVQLPLANGVAKPYSCPSGSTAPYIRWPHCIANGELRDDLRHQVSRARRLRLSPVVENASRASWSMVLAEP